MIPADLLQQLFSTDIDESCAAAREIGLHHSREECANLLRTTSTQTYEQLAACDALLHTAPWHPHRRELGPVPECPALQHWDSQHTSALRCLLDALREPVPLALRSFEAVEPVRRALVELLTRGEQLDSFLSALDAHPDDELTARLADILLMCDHERPAVRERMCSLYGHPQADVRLTIFYAITANAREWLPELSQVFAKALCDVDDQLAGMAFNLLENNPADLRRIRQSLLKHLGPSPAYHPDIAKAAAKLIR